MPDLHLQVLSIAQVLETTPEGREQWLHELLFFPEFRTLGHDPDRLAVRSKKLAQAVTRLQSLDKLGTRQAPESYTVRNVSLEVSPVRPSRLWEEPVTLTFPMIEWAHGTEALLAYLPALGIEVWCRDHEALPAAIEEQALFAIKRRGLARSLLRLARIQRGQELVVESLPWNAQPLTTTERYEAIYGDSDSHEKVLEKVATKLAPDAMPPAFEREEWVDRLAQCFAGDQARSILLVGRPGIGKTAIIKEAIRRGKIKRPVWHTSGGRLVAGQTGFGMWQERCQRLIREAQEGGLALYLGNLFELMQVGQSVSQSESIASFLRPAMVRGDLLALSECTTQQLGAIEAQDPKILDAFRVLKMEEPTPEASRRILDHIASGSSTTPEALAQLDALHRRYATYSAYPGRPVRFLKRLLGTQSPPRACTVPDVLTAFSEETGLPRWLLDEGEPFDVATVRTWFQERVHAQDPAVDAVLRMLATIKTRLARPGKPLGSFLFLGPTGVGKTELAKTLALFLYQSRDRLVRFDMSEYHRPSTASRLVSDRFSGNEGLLTAAVRDQPFSVILLDEFEKATPKIFDLFLQVLGEGRLTDGAGRHADFTNAVVIMTSNLGASTFKRGTLGFRHPSDDNTTPVKEHFLGALRQAVRPEFFNRIDALVPFMPLSQASVAAIAQRELKLATQREGLRDRHLQLEVSAPLLDQVIAIGYDPRYGARPLKRAIERHLLLPTADFLNETPRERGRLLLDLSPRQDTQVTYLADGESLSKSTQELRRAHVRLENAAAQRRWAHQLAHSAMVTELQSQADRLLKIRAQSIAHTTGRSPKKRRRTPPSLTPQQETRLEELQKALLHVENALSESQSFEEASLLQLYQESEDGTNDSLPKSPVAQGQELLIDVYRLFTEPPAAISLILQADAHSWLSQLCQAYADIASHWSSAPLEVALYAKRPTKEFLVQSESERAVKPEIVSGEDAQTALQALTHTEDHGVVGLRIHSEQAVLRLRSEAGLHLLEDAKANKHHAFVQVYSDPLELLTFSLSEVARGRDLVHEPLRRAFRSGDRPSYRDPVLGLTRELGAFDSKLLASLIERQLVDEARRAL